MLFQFMLTLSMKQISSDKYEITRNHLKRLCNDTIAGHLTTTDLNTIAFALIGSEYFTWDKDETTTDGKIIDQTIYDWDNPDIGYPLTNENLKRWTKYLETGEYTFDIRELKRVK